MKQIHKRLHRLINNSFFCGRSITILLIFLLGIKQWAIYTTYGGQVESGLINSALLYLGFLGNDLMILGIVLLLVFINLNISNKTIKWILNSVNILLMILFFIDIITIIFFQSRLSLFDMYSFFSPENSKYFFSYIAFALIFFILLCIFAFIISQKLLKKWKEISHQWIIALVFFCITLVITSINIVGKSSRAITDNILSLNISTIKNRYENKNIFNTETTKKYEDFFKNIQGKNKKPNVIVIFAESLSTVDSKRAGGIYNNLPLFDKIQSEGITLNNFIANGCTSETAHIATLEGIEPREYPRINNDQSYDSYATYQEPLPKFFNKQGYQTTFLSSVTLDFLNQKAFLSGLEYKTIIGEEAFKKEKKYVFNAAPDNDLYEKTLQTISGYNANNIKYFVTLQTISSHRPYDTPYGQDTSQMFSYVDKSLYNFYQKLKKSGFFENGILFIISDHRKMEAINKEEFQKFGLSSKSRAVATVIGKGISKNTFNNNIIQHTDIYNSIKYLIGDTNVQVSKLFNNVFSRQANRTRGVRYCRFAEKTYVRINDDGSSRRITNKKDDANILQYIQAYKTFEAEKLLGIKGINNYENPKKTEKTATGFVIIAHGGGTYKGWIPNTINTATRAKKDGADAIEFDISYTKDNKNIVLHGPSLQTTACGPNKSITGFTLDEVKKQCPLRNGEKILSLEEFLTKTKGRFGLYFLEIKVNDQSKAEQQTLDAINTVIKLGMEDKVVFISYDRTAKYIIGSHKKIRAGRDSYQEESELIYQFPHEFYVIPNTMLSKNIVEIAQAMKKTFVVYTLNTKEEIQNAINLGAKYIITDNVPLAKILIKVSQRKGGLNK